ncbi:MAG: TSUP family transporter [Ruminiclostridium sp.]|nr:TSUP family transporter [Ruminiclostridium sp.]
MEWIWYIIAALGAGVGTGLAGISAATVMVPILIVLCPSFAGETGAYQATAIALASDILGSAAASAVYIKHRNIDLKRGRIMLVCILAMCTVGSYVAFIVGNTVLGGFTLILTFCIGIRFLLKPDSGEKSKAAKGQRLDFKGAAISVFFGLTIGFGTGFVGTGGGMMMLIVFTAFLGMERKTAVGTSTFIMTFTALIASVSHILIHPAIVLEKWDVMLLCIVVSTLSGIVSAKFANKVNGRIVGIVTGAALTLLGGAMIFLNYREFFTTNELVRQTAGTFLRYLIYICSFAAVLILIHLLFRIPKDIFRKLLHIAAFTSSIFVVMNGDGWLPETLTMLLFAAVVFPILAAGEKWRGYKDLFVEKKNGEAKNSLLLLFLSQAVFIAFTCGFLGKPYILVAATAAWGLGDIAAAWVGRPFGRHKVRFALADHSKSWEGTGAMAAVSFTACLVSLLLFSPYSVPAAVIISLIVGAVSAFTELCSKGGTDTATVPAADIIVLGLISVIAV